MQYKSEDALKKDHILGWTKYNYDYMLNVW